MEARRALQDAKQRLRDARAATEQLQQDAAAALARAEAAAAEAKRLKAHDGAAPLFLGANVAGCSIAELRALQQEIAAATKSTDAEMRELRAGIAAEKGRREQAASNVEALKAQQAQHEAAGVDWRMRALQTAVETRDSRIVDLRAQVSRIKQLEAKLAVALDKATSMSCSVQVRQQHSLSKARSDNDWAAARTTAVRRTSATPQIGSHF
jgi:hypothetical protein